MKPKQYWTCLDLTSVKPQPSSKNISRKNLSSDKSYPVINAKEARIVKGVMACDVSPVAMFGAVSSDELIGEVC